MLWILLHHHAHGVDAFLVEAASDDTLPEPEDVLTANASSLDPDDDDEYTEWRGPVTAYRPSEA